MTLKASLVSSKSLFCESSSKISVRSEARSFVLLARLTASCFGVPPYRDWEFERDMKDLAALCRGDQEKKRFKFFEERAYALIGRYMWKDEERANNIVKMLRQ